MKISTLSFSMVLLTLLFVGCDFAHTTESLGSSTISNDSISSIEGFDYGRIEKNVYYNDYFKTEITFDSSVRGLFCLAKIR